MDSILKKEFEYFLAHQEELVKMYEGKFGVLVNSCVNSFFKQRSFRLIVSSV